MAAEEALLVDFQKCSFGCFYQWGFDLWAFLIPSIDSTFIYTSCLGTLDPEAQNCWAFGAQNPQIHLWIWELNSRILRYLDLLGFRTPAR